MAANKRKKLVMNVDLYLGSVLKVIYSVLRQKARNTDLDTNSQKNEIDSGITESHANLLKEGNDEHENTHQG